MPSVVRRFGPDERTTPLGKGTDGSATRSQRWLAKGYADEDSAEAAVILAVPPFLGVVPLKDVTLEDMPGKDTYGFRANYELKNANATGGGGGSSSNVISGYDYTWDTGNSTFKRTQSLNTTAYGIVGTDGAGSGTTPPDFKGAINVNGDKVEGVDVEDGAWEEEVQFYLKPEKVTTELKRRLFKLRQHVNDAPFLYFDPGECRFRGARAVATKGKPTQITLKLAGAPNEVIPAKDGLPEIDKKGHYYIWIYRKKAIKTAAGGGTDYLYAKPVAAYVEQVYYEASFDILSRLIAGIGTGGYDDTSGGDDTDAG